MNPAPPPQFVKDLPSFEISKLDKLETYALATLCTHAEHKAATEPPATLVELANQAIATRAVLLADVNSLISRGLLAPSAVDGLQGVHGYKNVMMDICTLASVLKKNAAKIAERTSVKREELTTAEDLANRLGKAVGVRDQSPQTVAEAVRNRQAAFTLFIHAYEEVRAAVQYLRRKQGDADSIAPSLYLSRGQRKKTADESPADPAVPVVAQPVTTAPTAPGNNAPAAHPAASAVAKNGPFMD